jgi:adenosylmethionine-8-amino-7-oxononanoate aminotransferase
MDWQQYDTHIWHPFTQHALEDKRIAIASGKGALLFDVDGKAYIDGISSWWVNLFGHAQPDIAAAIRQQAEKLEHVIFAGFTHEPACRLADSLLKILPPNFSKVFFSDNGSTAVEVALKMAVQFWHNQGKAKHKIISFKNAYHGDTFGAMSVGKSAFFSAFDALLFDVIQIDLPVSKNFSEIKKTFETIVKQGDTACFIFEPLVQGSAGMCMYDAVFLDELIQTAQANDVLCIADEVMTGFGRTGKRFAIDYLHNKPDMICLSKGLTGGFLPLGLTVCSQKIYDAFYASDKFKTFFHGHSYTANPLSCAAANASLHLLEQYTDKIKQLSAWQKTFATALENFSSIKNIRTLGTIAAFEVESTNLPFGEQQGGGYFSNIRDVLYRHFLEAGVLLRPLGNTVYIMPPYCITQEQLSVIYEAVKAVIR